VALSKHGVVLAHRVFGLGRRWLRQGLPVGQSFGGQPVQWIPRHRGAHESPFHEAEQCLVVAGNIAREIDVKECFEGFERLPRVGVATESYEPIEFARLLLELVLDSVLETDDKELPDREYREHYGDREEDDVGGENLRTGAPRGTEPSPNLPSLSVRRPRGGRQSGRCLVRFACPNSHVASWGYLPLFLDFPSNSGERAYVNWGWEQFP
jgi:hypothetical protein